MHHTCKIACFTNISFLKSNSSPRCISRLGQVAGTFVRVLEMSTSVGIHAKLTSTCLRVVIRILVCFVFKRLVIILIITTAYGQI